MSSLVCSTFHSINLPDEGSTKASGKLKILPEEPEDGVHSIQPTAETSQRQSRSGPQTDRPPIQGTIAEQDEDDDDDDDSSEDEDEGEEQRLKISKQLDLARIPEGSMRRDARRITRKGRASLPRVTAYSTATSYRMRELTKWLQARRDTHRTNAMTFDECVYSTYSYDLIDQDRNMQNDTYRNQAQHVNVTHTKHDSNHAKTADLLGIPELNERENDAKDTSKNEHSAESTQIARREEAKRRRRERFAVHGMVPEVFFMEYGTVVIWGMTINEEKRLLRELRKFEVEKLAHEDIESEDLNWYLADYSRIYNDVITLRKGSSYMTKLSLSHALAQSTKISFFEGVIDNTIDTTKDIPQSIAESGKIGLPPVDIMKQIGHLFILRMNIHLVGSIVDSPEIFWAQPDLEPLYSAARSYLEIPQRIELLNARVEVLQDMLQLLKDQVTSSHSEWLEIIVIILILLEIILGVATMVVDLYFA
ncbi:DUF155-domain-containing protein [Meira miltonrushii]|uniref:DUF155-domain-containing protein n=1 Tax=Meira miltonrushii TaxID=1280837 RepID=A0A316VHN0_9BASI|nr:DUF155-domain-containing protein [Meira miltonrushii]PWN37102.1 DUF155-domain-containing protein [Meira miltonrushii]